MLGKHKIQLGKGLKIVYIIKENYKKTLYQIFNGMRSYSILGGMIVKKFHISIKLLKMI